MAANINHGKYGPEFMNKVKLGENAKEIGSFQRAQRSDDKDLEVEKIILESLVHNGEYFCKCINNNMSLNEASARFLAGRTVEEHIADIKNTFDNIPEDKRNSDITDEKIDELADNIVDAGYKSKESSVLFNEKLDDIEDSTVYVKYDEQKQQYIGLAHLNFKDEGYAEAYRRSGLENQTKRSFENVYGKEHVRVLGNELDVYIKCPFGNERAEMTVIHMNEFNKPYSSNVRISLTESNLFKDFLEKNFTRTSMENHIARKLSYNRFDVEAAKSAALNEDKTAVTMNLVVSDKTLEEIRKLAGFDNLPKAKDIEDKTSLRHSVYAALSENGDIKVTLKGDGIENELQVPCKIEDKNVIKDAAEKLLKMPVKDYLAKAKLSEQTIRKTTAPPVGHGN